MLTTLADDPRNNLPEWYLEIRTKARNLCSAHDAAGALGLIAQDVDWQQFPGVLTNPVDFAAGQAPDYRARPTFDYPADHAGNAAPAVLSVYRQAVERHGAFTNASSLLATALLESIGDTNRTQLQASFHPLPLYAITPAQIVTTMITLYGVATGTDLQRLREPLLEPLKALAELEPFMAKFKLNTLKLTASGYGKSPYDYFEAFLTTLQGFPIVATSMSTFYAQNPRVADHTIANLFPFLIPQIPFLLAQSNASPFSGAATQRQPNNKNKNKSNKNTKGAKTHARQQWGPKGPTATASHFAGASVQAAVTHNPDSDLQRENYQHQQQ
jgi:hypothetical protein